MEGQYLGPRLLMAPLNIGDLSKPSLKILWTSKLVWLIWQDRCLVKGLVKSEKENFSVTSSPGCSIILEKSNDRPSTLGGVPDRKSTRLNSSHVRISYAVFCLKKKK